MELIFSGIIGGAIVLLFMKFAPKKSILKLLLKMFLVVRDYLLSTIGEGFEKFKDLFCGEQGRIRKGKRKQKKRFIRIRRNHENQAEGYFISFRAEQG